MLEGTVDVCEPGGREVGRGVVDGDWITVLPGIVVSDPSGSVEIDGGMVDTDNDCELDPEGKVSVVPGIFVGVVTGPAAELDDDGEKVNFSPSVVRVVGAVTCRIVIVLDPRMRKSHLLLQSVHQAQQ